MHRQEQISATSGGMQPRPLPVSDSQAASCAEQVERFREQMLDVSPDDLDDDSRLELLHALEVLTRTLGAVAAQTQVAFHVSQVARQVQAGVRPARAGTSVAHDLAVTRMTSPYWSSRELTSAKALVTEMPHTLAALAAGQISPLQARVVTEVTSCLSAEDRAEVDTRLAPSLPGSPTAEITANARALVYEVDPAGFVARARKAAADRGVSIRPRPDVMGLLSARLPAPQAIACYQALREKAIAMRSSGDPRSLGQLMADLLYERLTGRSVVDGIDVEVGLVITDSALFTGTSEAAFLDGYGPIPAELARELLRPQGPADETSSADDEAAPSPAGEASAPEVGQASAPEMGETPPASPGDPAADADAHGAERPAQETDICPEGIRCTSFACALVHGDPGTACPDPVRPVQGRDPASRESALLPSRGSPPEHRAHRQRPVPGFKAAKVWLRRLFTDPVTGVLTCRDPRARLFTGQLRAFLIARDRTCRNAWCGAPIGHIDHFRRHADGGESVEDNGRGLCARCNLDREEPGHVDRPDTSYRPPPPLLPTFLVAPTTNGP